MSNKTASISIISVAEEIESTNCAGALRFFRSFDWKRKFLEQASVGSSAKITFALDNGFVLQIGKNDTGTFNVLVDLPSERKVLGMLFVPERHTSHFERLPEDRVTQLIEVFYSGEKAGILSLIEKTSEEHV